MGYDEKFERKREEDGNMAFATIIGLCMDRYALLCGLSFFQKEKPATSVSLNTLKLFSYINDLCQRNLQTR